MLMSFIGHARCGHTMVYTNSYICQFSSSQLLSNLVLHWVDWPSCVTVVDIPYNEEDSENNKILCYFTRTHITGRLTNILDIYIAKLELHV